MIKRETWATVVGISTIPALWAVLTNHISIHTGTTAMAAAAVYVLAAKSPKDGIRMTIGELLGIVWTMITLWLMKTLTFNADIATFLILFVMVAVIIIICSFLPKVIDLFGWLVGYALALTVLIPVAQAGGDTMSYCIQLAVSFLVGIWCVGCVGGMIIQAIAKPREK